MSQHELPQSPRLRPWRDFLRLQTFLRPYAWRMTAMIALSLAGSLLGLAMPYLSKYLVDGALLHRDVHALWIASVLMFAATLVGIVLTYVSGRGYVRMSSEMLFDMRVEVYQHLHQLSPRFYARARLGDLVSRLNGDVAEIQRISADTFLSTLSNVAFLIGSLIMMIWLSWKLFIVGMVLIPVTVWLYRFYQVRITRLTAELRQRSADMGTLFVETLMGIRLLNCFNASEYELDRFRQRNDAFVKTVLRFQNTSLLGRTTPSLLLTGATIAVFFYGGEQIILGRMSIGTLVAFMAYHARLLSPVQNLLGLSTALSSARVSLGRILDLLDTAIEVTDPAQPVRLPAIRSGVDFRDVTLIHDGRKVLEDVSFHIPAGRFTVLVGASGAGKSSVADLAIRLLDPDQGAILIEGIDVRRVALAELRRKVVLIEQTPHLLHASLTANICYGRSDASAAEVERAARAAGLGDLLDRLPDRLETIAGERGLTLSAGERQRVALARAFLADPEILILDEPSAALDEDREHDLIASLREQFFGKTILAITHRAVLAAAADHVLRIEQGRLIGTGVAA